MGAMRTVTRRLLVGLGVKPRRLKYIKGVGLVVSVKVCKKHDPNHCKCFSIPPRFPRQKAVPMAVAHRRAVAARKEGRK